MQDKFIKLANNWENIFLTWGPGTWKSYTLKKWLAENKHQTIAITWPTWISAINIWWATLHSTFKIYWNDYRFIKRQLINWKQVHKLVIDEISMVSCDLLDYLDRILKSSRHSTKPFWWMQVIVVGDLDQLPPIFWSDNHKRYNELMMTKWSVYFNVADAYGKGDFKEITLTENRRAKDAKLIWLLNRLKDWDMSAAKEFKKADSTEDYEGFVKLAPYNNIVDNINSVNLDKLEWKQYVFKSKVVWEFSLNNVITPQILVLKIWARVMITKNLWNHWLYNWDLWTVVAINSKRVIIKSDRLLEQIEITYDKWRNIRYDEHWHEKEIWSFIQMPLRLAYAMTIHKSQGLTIDKIVVWLNNTLSREMIYVALSRWTTYDNIYVKWI